MLKHKWTGLRLEIIVQDQEGWENENLQKIKRKK